MYAGPSLLGNTPHIHAVCQDMALRYKRSFLSRVLPSAATQGDCPKTKNTLIPSRPARAVSRDAGKQFPVSPAHKTNPPYPPLTGGYKKAMRPRRAEGALLFPPSGGVLLLPVLWGGVFFLTPLSRGVGGLPLPSQELFQQPLQGGLEVERDRGGSVRYPEGGFSSPEGRMRFEPSRRPCDVYGVSVGDAYMRPCFFAARHGPHICGPYTTIAPPPLREVFQQPPQGGSGFREGITPSLSGAPSLSCPASGAGRGTARPWRRRSHWRWPPPWARSPAPRRPSPRKDRSSRNPPR